MKIFLYSIVVIALLLVTFFGLGPVLFADGSMNERLVTLLVVVLLYLLLGWITLKIRKYKKDSKN